MSTNPVAAVYAKKLDRDRAPAKAPNLKSKFAQLRAELAASLIDREDEIDLTLTALIGQTSLLFVGPAGCAKSMTLESIFKAVAGGKVFTWLMGKFTEPDEIFGPVDILALKAGKRRRITAGKLPEAHVAFLDEFWKASTAIANSLLRIVNERVFDNGDGEAPVPLKCLVAASNEYPQDGELGAMFDRFVLRKNVNYVGRRASRKRLLRTMDHRPKLTVSLELSDLDAAHKEAMALPFPEASWELAELIVENCIAEGVRPSDRRLPLIGKVCRAFAYACGANEVKPEHLEVLAHVLWTDPEEQPLKVAKIVARIANPFGSIIADKLGQAESVGERISAATTVDLLKRAGTDAVPKLTELCKELEKLPDDPRRDKALTRVTALSKTAYMASIGRRE